jgi:hypothetical protein
VIVTTDRVAGAVLALIGLFVVSESVLSARRLPLGTLRTPGPAYVPVLLAALLIAFGIVLVLWGRGAMRMRLVAWTEWRHAVAIFAVCAFAAFMLERIGFRLTMALVLLVLLALVERQGVVFAVLYAVAFVGGAFLVFDTLLRVPLPRGPFGF